MYRLLSTLIAVAVFAAGTAYGLIVHGYAYRTCESDHSGIQVRFYGPFGEYWYDYTNSSGYYEDTLITPGYYDIRYSHSGCDAINLTNVWLYADDNELSDVTLDCGISGSLSGTLGPGDVCVTGDISVASGTVLTIRPDTRLLFWGPYKFDIYGRLTAVGTAQDSIVFTHYYPTEESKWGGLRFYNSSSDLSYLKYCRIEYGKASSGGGIYLSDSDPTIEHCTIHYNSAIDSRGGGGGIYSYQSDPTFSHCIIGYNGAPAMTEGLRDTYTGVGGGVYCYGGEPTFTDCIIDNNSAKGSGGGVYCSSSDAVFENCTISNNWTEYQNRCGGGLYVTGGNPKLIECVIHHNFTQGNGGGGGGVYCLYSDSADSILHCTISDNFVGIDGHGGGVYLHSCSSILNSTIIAFSASGEGIYFDGSSSTVVEYCDVYGNAGGVYGGTRPSGFGAIDRTNHNGDPCDRYFNVFCDPKFVHRPTGDYHLTWANYPVDDETKSCCIDAGDLRYVMVPMDTSFVENEVGESGDGSTATPEDPEPPMRPYGDVPRKFIQDPDGTRRDIGAFYFHQGSRGSGVCGIDGENKPGDAIPVDYLLAQNYPNPFNPTTTIRYGLPHAGQIRIAVHNILGQQVAVLMDEFRPAGNYSAVWNASNVPSGVYFAQMAAGTYAQSVKLMVLK